MKGILNPLYLLFIFCCLSSMPVWGQEQVNNETELLRYWEAHLCAISQKDNVPFSAKGKLKDNANALLKIQKQVSGKPSDTLLLPALNDLMADLQHKDYDLAVAFVQFKAAVILYKQYKKTEGIELILHTKELLGDKGMAEKFPGIGSYYSFMGQIYIDNGEPEFALQLLQKAAQYNFCDKLDEYYCWGNIGLTYFNLGKTGDALKASFKALEIIKQLGDSAEIVSMLGNIGTIYLKHGDYKNALEFLGKDYEGSIRYERWESAIAVQIMKAKSYLNLKINDSAGIALKIADSIARHCHCGSYGAKKEYFEQLSKWFSQKGDWPEYVKSIDSFTYYSNKLSSEARATISTFLGTELKVASNMHAAKMQLVESERQRQLLVRNLIIVIIIAVLLFVLLVLNGHRKARKAEQKIYTLNLENARKQLENYLENIRTKNQLLEELQEQIEQYRSDQQTGTQQQAIDIELASRIEQASLITEEGWLEFTSLVEQVHQHFFTKLNVIFPNLTPAEVRLITLIKLKFSIKESASMLGISADSVRKARYRLKKKLSLEEDTSLDEMIYMI
ncbi:MAG: tetratricopeptide repeat protein [Taibaiella sp.]|nr:tetratricopeptide repeat protein [Taibaiella sp.]